MVRSQLSTGGDLMRRVIRDNGLSITMFALFLVFLVAQSIAGYTVLSIFLRQRGSPKSKPVAAPHAQTGSS
jgi:hypothetical protein